tara:strand:+ start:110 stop:1285 length:1176 start_codon:yes stop_codon:yes gene_type:complete
LKADFLLKIAFLVKNVIITRRNIVNKVVFILDRRIDMKIKSVTQLIDLVRNEKVDFTKTPQVNGVDIGGGTPGGSDAQIQFNNDGAFGGSSNLTFDGTTLTGSYTGSLAEFTTITGTALSSSAVSASNIVLAETKISPSRVYKNPPDPVSRVFSPDLYYKFNSDFSDSSTFGRTATPAGTAVPVINTSVKKLGAGSAQIKANGRLKYLTDGSTSGNTTAIPLHQYQVGWSVAFWFYAASTPADQFWLFAKTTDNTWEAGARALYVDSSGNVHWARHGIANVTMLSHASNPICDGQWHHIVATYWQWDPVDPGAIKLRVYLDGASVDVVAGVNMASWAGAVGKTFFTRGDASGGNDFYIDDFMYTNYPLSKATAIALWNSGNGTPADEADIL